MTTIEFKGTGTETLTEETVNSKITSTSPNGLTVTITGYKEIDLYAFNGKTKIEQHKMVYSSLKGKMGNQLHALALKTKEKNGSTN